MAWRRRFFRRRPSSRTCRCRIRCLRRRKSSGQCSVISGQFSDASPSRLAFFCPLLELRAIKIRAGQEVVSEVNCLMRLPKSRGFLYSVVKVSKPSTVARSGAPMVVLKRFSSHRALFFSTRIATRPSTDTENDNMKSKYTAFWMQASTVVVLALLFIASSAVAQTENILHRFNPTTADGLNPQSGLVADKSGNLYGTTYQGGTADWGTVYQLKPPATAGGAWTETILHDFTNNADGASPLGSLTFDKSGNLFGTTIYGGVGVNGNSNGTVFELSPPATSGGTWTYKVIASFDDGVVAINPVGGLVFDAAGNLYGTSAGGIEIELLCGETPCGNVFELQPPAVSRGAWTGKSIYNFGTSGANDGTVPNYVVFGAGGALYGTTSFGGALEAGTFYKLTPAARAGGDGGRE